MIGHSNHSGSRFVELLKVHEIERVIDIRTYPKSRWPQFNQRSMTALLEAQGIEYQHAPLLGGRNPLLAPEILLELRNYLPPVSATCFLCSEGDPQGCHRHSLIAPAVRGLGYSVVQILKDGSLWEDR